MGVMPDAAYPKVYVVGERSYEIHNAVEDASFQASPLYSPGLQPAQFPEIMVPSPGVDVQANNTAQDASVRADYSQS